MFKIYVLSYKIEKLNKKKLQDFFNNKLLLSILLSLLCKNYSFTLIAQDCHKYFQRSQINKFIFKFLYLDNLKICTIVISHSLQWFSSS